MISSVPDAPLPQENVPAEASLLRDVAERLCSSPVRAVRPSAAGGNSRLWRVETEAGPVALKRYPLPHNDPRDRMGRECAALALLNEDPAAPVPRLLAKDPDHRVILMSWVAGAPVTTADPAAMAGLLDLLHRLHALAPRAAALPEAMDGCLSGEALAASVAARLTRLRQGLPDGPARTFLEQRAAPALIGLLCGMRNRLREAGRDPARPLEAGAWTFSPSDLGFHNALRDDEGRVMFLDLEYAGRDDPAKLICDTLLHPGARLDQDQRRQFFRAAMDLYQGADLAARLEAYAPVLAGVWSLILLNAHLPERALPTAEARDRLERAKVMLDRAIARETPVHDFL